MYSVVIMRNVPSVSSGTTNGSRGRRPGEPVAVVEAVEGAVILNRPFGSGARGCGG